MTTHSLPQILADSGQKAANLLVEELRISVAKALPQFLDDMKAVAAEFNAAAQSGVMIRREHAAQLAERANAERDHDPCEASVDFLDGYVAGFEKAAEIIRRGQVPDCGGRGMTTCSDCLFWKQRFVEGGKYVFPVGDCRRHSPKASMNQGRQFPQTQESCWCGDFSPIVMPKRVAA